VQRFTPLFADAARFDMPFAAGHGFVQNLRRGPRAAGSGLAGRSKAVRVRGDAQDVQVAGLGLEDEEHVEPPQRDGLDAEEVDREHPGGLGAQELPPATVAAAGWRRRDPGPLED
jgi:hypothetical protein